MQLMKGNGNIIPCPISGCDKQIMEHNLIENKRLERKVAQHVRITKDGMDDIEVKKVKNYIIYHMNSFFF